MSYMVVSPEALVSAADSLADLGTRLDAANSAAAEPITSVLAAAEDEVSAAIATLFSAQGQSYQALNAHMAKFHAEFVRALSGSAGSYASAEGQRLRCCSRCLTWSTRLSWLLLVGR